MAGRKLTEEERALFAERLADSRARNAKEKAERKGTTYKPSELNVRSAEQIMADIEKVKADPKFQKKVEAYKKAAAEKNKATEAPKTESISKTPIKKQGTQIDHHTTSASSFIKPVGGMVIKTPEVKPSSTKQKTPGSPNTSVKNK